MASSGRIWSSSFMSTIKVCRPMNDLFRMGKTSDIWVIIIIIRACVFKLNGVKTNKQVRVFADYMFELHFFMNVVVENIGNNSAEVFTRTNVRGPGCVKINFGSHRRDLDLINARILWNHLWRRKLWNPMRCKTTMWTLCNSATFLKFICRVRL